MTHITTCLHITTHRIDMLPYILYFLCRFNRLHDNNIYIMPQFFVICLLLYSASGITNNIILNLIHSILILPEVRGFDIPLTIVVNVPVCFQTYICYV